MKKLILLALVCTGFAVTTPFTAQAIDSEKIGQNLDRPPNMSLAEPLGTRIAQYVGVASPLENRDRNRNDQNRDNRNRDNQDRDNEGRSYQSGDSPGERLRQRLFVVYYRNHDDSRSERLRQRKWIYESKHYSRRDAQRAANRLERRGYRTQILG
jgi:hypothetical protein